jgi:hypothetical protein
MEKLEGHVCQPITPWLEKKGIEGGFGWNAKTPCRPDKEREVRKIREELVKCNVRIWNKVMKGKKVYRRKGMKTLSEEMRDSFVRKEVFEKRVDLVWIMNQERWSGCVDESRLWEVRKILDQTVNCPVDKHNAEAIAM